MNRRRRRNDDPADHDGHLPHEVAAAMKAAGQLPPTTAREVAALEEALAGREIPLPAVLRNPGEVFARSAMRGPVVVPFPSAPRVSAARAARQGRAIDPEVELRMRRDRQAAEREMDQRGDDA